MRCDIHGQNLLEGRMVLKCKKYLVFHDVLRCQKKLGLKKRGDRTVKAKKIAGKVLMERRKCLFCTGALSSSETPHSCMCDSP